SEEKEIVCAIKYEQLPVFYYICGIGQLNGNGQNRGNWRNGVEIIEIKVEANTETNEGKKRSGDESELMGLKEKEKIKGGEEDSESGSTIEKRYARLMCDGGGRNKGKRKRIRDGNGENVDESPAKISGGLAMLWKDGIKVDIQNYSRHHIDSVIQLEDQRSFRFMGKSKALMDDFCNIIEELSSVDIKMIKGWYTWVNNREGSTMVKGCQVLYGVWAITTMFLDAETNLQATIVDMSSSANMVTNRLVESTDSSRQLSYHLNSTPA
ncbi:hypothetical protein Gorai_024571, partial [Gossypium raimondii]|nr:hypothetical protein [Gossypium raimondii]